jgi:hypothetical protein
VQSAPAITESRNKKLTTTGQNQPCAYRPVTGRLEVIMAVEMLSYR